jgi:hypothetical protein
MAALSKLLGTPAGTAVEVMVGALGEDGVFFGNKSQSQELHHSPKVKLVSDVGVSATWMWDSF